MIMVYREGWVERVDIRRCQMGKSKGAGESDLNACDKSTVILHRSTSANVGRVESEVWGVKHIKVKSFAHFPC